MSNPNLDWNILCFWDSFVLEEYNKLCYNENIIIDHLKNGFLFQNEVVNKEYITITRNDFCKVYILCGILEYNLSICMNILDTTLSKITSLNNNFFFKFEFLPNLFSLPLQKCIFHNIEESNKNELIEKIYILIKNILIYLYFPNKNTWIILISGTSGSGKSTISSYLASYLKIKYILSTDTIRHILCSIDNYTNKKILNCSTYEVYNYCQELLNINNNENKTILGYLLQSSIIEDFIYKIIENIIIEKKSIIVEGVHLTPILLEKIENLCLKYQVKLNSFLIYIQDSQEHIKRFQQRSKGILNSKYLNNILRIREIQDYLLLNLKKKSDVICIDNTSNNIDDIIEKHILKYISKKLI